MNAPANSMDRVLEVALKAEGLGLVMYEFELYCDETGGDGGFPLMAVGGYLVRSRHARRLESEWSETLSRYNVPYFHQVDLSHGAGIYKSMVQEDRNNLQIDLYKLINKRVEFSICSAVPLHRYSESMMQKIPDRSTGISAYSFCLDFGFIPLLGWLEQWFPQMQDLSVFYESGHQHAAEALATFNHNFPKRKPNF